MRVGIPNFGKSGHRFVLTSTDRCMMTPMNAADDKAALLAAARVLGARVEQARERRGWDQSDLARRASLSPSYVSRLENAGFTRPSANKLRAISDALGIRVTDLTDPTPAAVPVGIEAELAAMFKPEEAPLVAEILRAWARHDEPRRRFLLRTMKPLVTEIPD